MGRFIRTILLFSVTLGAFLVLVFLYRIVRTQAISWELPESTHVVFAGASHVVKGVNDSLYPGSVNLARGSERYLFTYLKLERVLAANPQVDTVFLEFAPTDIHRNTDSKYYTANEMSLFLPMYFPYFGREEWALYAGIDLPLIGTLLLQKVLKDVPDDIRTYGRYFPEEKKFDSRNEKHEIDEWLEKGHEINYRYLNKIISLCAENEVDLVFLYMPMYTKEKFFDHDYFYTTYRTKFSAIELLDYSDLELPDHYRSDEHHLNKYGARFFTDRLVNDLGKRAE